MTIFSEEIFEYLSDPSTISIGDTIEYELLTSVMKNNIGSGIVTEISNFESAKTYFLVGNVWVTHKRVVVRKIYNKRKLN
jgi:hypothetical protein